MVSQLPPPTDQNVALNQHHTEPYGESYFPRQLSWYAPEAPQGILASTARLIRENPRLAITLATAAGTLLALLTLPARQVSPTDLDA